MNWREGQAVEIAAEGRTVEAVIVLASGNGRSLMVGFDAMFLGYVTLMPLLMHPGSTDYRELHTGKIVTVKGKQ